MAKVTAENITDEQIRELRSQFYADIAQTYGAELISFPEECASGRARCADLWNARHAKDGEP